LQNSFEHYAHSADTRRMTQKNREFQAVPARLNAGVSVALLPTRVLDIATSTWMGASLAKQATRQTSLAEQATRQTSLAEQATRQTSLAEQATRQTSLAEQATRQTSPPLASGIRGLFAALGVTQSPAALRAQTLGAPPGASEESAYFVAVELCHFQIELGGARWMAHGPMLNLTSIERAQIAAALATVFNTPDAQLIVHQDNELSVLCNASTLPVQSLFPDEALGLELKNALPTPLIWQRYLNEAQMLLASLPLNLARSARGEPTVNSVWFWGACAVETDIPALLVCYVGPDPILQALNASVPNPEAIRIADYRHLSAAALETAVTALPDTTKMWLNNGSVYQLKSVLSLTQRLRKLLFGKHS
jgi:hypothetical protein